MADAENDGRRETLSDEDTGVPIENEQSPPTSDEDGTFALI